MNLKSVAIRSGLCLVVLFAAALFLFAHERTEVVPPHDSVKNFPYEIGNWLGSNVPLDPQVLQVLGPGDFAERSFTREGAPSIDLFLAYFSTQRTGDTIHSPKNCLPGSGWSPLQSGYITFAGPGGKPMTVNRYVIARGTDRQLVLYWYQSHGRVIASEYWAKYYLVADSIHLNRTDAALVRIVTPITGSDNIASAQRRAVAFAQQIAPKLDRYIPR